MALRPTRATRSCASAAHRGQRWVFCFARRKPRALCRRLNRQLSCLRLTPSSGRGLIPIGCLRLVNLRHATGSKCGRCRRHNGLSCWRCGKQKTRPRRGQSSAWAWSASAGSRWSSTTLPRGGVSCWQTWSRRCLRSLWLADARGRRTASNRERPLAAAMARNVEAGHVAAAVALRLSGGTMFASARQRATNGSRRAQWRLVGLPAWGPA